METMCKTPKGTLQAYSYDNPTLGIQLSIFKQGGCLCLDYDKDNDQLVLWINDDIIKKNDIKVVHTDENWNPIQEKAPKTCLISDLL